MIMQSEFYLGSDYKKENLENKTKNLKIAAIYQNKNSCETS
jgi:hypothetical protein